MSWTDKMRYIIAWIFVLFILSSCTSRMVSHTPRTAIEQLLLSTAVDKALSKLQLIDCANKKIYLDFSNLQAYDSEYIKSAVRSKVGENCTAILEKPDDADLIFEISSGGFGNEYKDTLFGIPALPVPGSPMTLPELALWKTVEQDGIIKLLITVYQDEKVISSNHYYGKAERDERFLLWMRSQPKDDIRKAWEEADETLQNR